MRLNVEEDTLPRAKGGDQDSSRWGGGEGVGRNVVRCAWREKGGCTTSKGRSTNRTERKGVGGNDIAFVWRPRRESRQPQYPLEMLGVVKNGRIGLDYSAPDQLDCHRSMKEETCVRVLGGLIGVGKEMHRELTLCSRIPSQQPSPSMNPESNTETWPPRHTFLELTPCVQVRE